MSKPDYKAKYLAVVKEVKRQCARAKELEREPQQLRERIWQMDRDFRAERAQLNWQIEAFANVKKPPAFRLKPPVLVKTSIETHFDVLNNRTFATTYYHADTSELEYQVRDDGGVLSLYTRRQYETWNHWNLQYPPAGETEPKTLAEFQAFIEKYHAERFGKLLEEVPNG